MNHPVERVYLELDFQSQDFKTSEIGLSETKKRNEDKKRRVSEILSSRQTEPELSLALYSFIFSNCDVGLLSDSDLSLPVTDSRTGKHIRVGICDLLYYVTEKASRPTPESVALFRALDELFKLPRMFVRNETFRARINKRS